MTITRYQLSTCFYLKKIRHCPFYYTMLTASYDQQQARDPLKVSGDTWCLSVTMRMRLCLTYTNLCILFGIECLDFPFLTRVLLKNKVQYHHHHITNALALILRKHKGLGRGFDYAIIHFMYCSDLQVNDIVTLFLCW